MDLGIIGLERSGKSTVFNAVTRGHARTGTFGGAEPNIGVVKVPDDRLERVAEVVKAKKVTHAEVRYLDFPGGFSVRGEGPPPAYLASLSQCDALVHVVRAFRNESVPHPQNSVDPDRDVAAVNLELAFADLAMLERRVDKLESTVRSSRAGEREAGERELALVQRMREALEGEMPLREQEFSSDDRRIISGYQLLTLRPVLVVVNIDESDVANADEVEASYRERWARPQVHVAALCGKLEQELTELSEEEGAEFRRDLGIAEGGLERMLRLSHDALGLITFITAGEKDTRAWPLSQGASALEAAGKVHSDIARGFVRAEVIGWQDLVDAGSWAEVRKRGLLRTEGKQYVVRDGDVINVLFSV